MKNIPESEMVHIAGGMDKVSKWLVRSGAALIGFGIGGPLGGLAAAAISCYFLD
ncbi:MAG: hypothetical protein H0V44_06095 [Planctomycetes bacterium]|nr:hypothetical protein [Planctomycetota bacterium]